MGEQKKQDGKNKLLELAVKQNLLLWQLSKSFLDIEKEILSSTKTLVAN